MTKLFDDLDRVEMHSMMSQDRRYEYLNQTARPAFALVRDTLERWLADYPTADRSELVTRFRSSETHTHRGAFFELYCHALLRAYGFEVETHPLLDAKGRPDFLVIDDGKPAFYLEATNVMPPNKQRAEIARDGPIDDCIARMRLQDFYVIKSSRSAGPRSPSLAKIKAFLRSKAASLDPDDDSVRHLHFEYREDGWIVDFRFHPKPPGQRDGGSGTSLGITAGPLDYSTPEKSIVSSLKKKSGKYGVLDLPLVIAINCLHEFVEFVEFEDIATSLYRAVSGASDGGFWSGPGEPKHTRVSAVLVVVQLVPWTIGSVDGYLWRNPHASRPLDRTFWPGSQVDWCKQSRQCVQRRGRPAPKTLGTANVSTAIRNDHAR